jgi:two-component sensor histidine kinase
MINSAVVRKFLISNWFLAAIPTVIIIVLLPALGSRYKIIVDKPESFGEQMIYSDVNSDNVSEMIFSGKGIPYYFISVKDQDLLIYDQWNLSGTMDPFLSEIYTGNYDKDSFEEIYVFTHAEDSLFLNVNEMLQHSGTRMDRIFITKIGFVNNEVTSLLKPIGLFDENDDGKDEFYFSISTGYKQQPRKIYFYDLVNKRLKSSQYTSTICLNPEMKDISGDSRPEIFGMMSGSGNYYANSPYTDSSTWLMVFNDHLNFSFPPVEFPGFANGLEIKGYEKGSFSGYVLSHSAGAADTSIMKSQIMLFTAGGLKVRSRHLSDFSTSNFLRLFVIKHNKSDRIYLLGDKLYEMNEKLEIIRTIDLPYSTKYFSYTANINSDDEDELLLYFAEDDELVIYSSGLDIMSDVRLKLPSVAWRISNFKSKDYKSKIFLGAGNTGYFLELRENKYFYLVYLSFPGIYFFFFFFILLIRRINTFQVVEKESLKQRLVTLQLQGIKAQLDPHFTFNTLNSVASLIYLDDRQAAYDYMNKFTQLLRVMLKDAERLYRSLGEEIDFVTTYLDLEKLRFGEKFEYYIETGEGVSQKEQVPKLVLQTFAENAVKHGLMPCAAGGILKIKAELISDYLKLTIEDNGIGRERAEGISTSTGKGLKLTSEFYEILNQINKKPIKHNITDLYTDEGKASGTRVEVWVPVEKNIS